MVNQRGQAILNNGILLALAIGEQDYGSGTRGQKFIRHG
jgi:hypothetical protein